MSTSSSGSASFVLPDLNSLEGQRHLAALEAVLEARRRWHAAHSARRLGRQLLFPSSRKIERQRAKQAAAAVRAAVAAVAAAEIGNVDRRQRFLDRRRKFQ